MKESRPGNRLAHAYSQMMERVKLRLDELERAEKAAFPRLSASIEHAAEKAVELGELSREEAHLIGGYLKRDLEDARHFLTTTGRDLQAWLRFDVELLEDRLLDFFRLGIDQSRLDLVKVESAEPAADMELYRSGEVTGPGTLQCQQCGELIVFHTPALIEACPACHEMIFLRVTEEL